MLLPPLLLLFYASEYNILSVERSRLFYYFTCVTLAIAGINCRQMCLSVCLSVGPSACHTLGFY